MTRNQLVITIILISLIACEQDVPVQKGGYGFSIGDPYGTL